MEEEKEEVDKMVVEAKKELLAAIQLQLEEAREQMQEEEEFVVCKWDKVSECYTLLLALWAIVIHEFPIQGAWVPCLSHWDATSNSYLAGTVQPSLKENL